MNAPARTFAALLVVFSMALGLPRAALADDTTSEDPHAYRTAAVVGGVVAIAGFGFSGALGAVALSKKNDARAVCPGANVCPTQEGVQRWHDADTVAGFSTIAFLVGCAGALEAAVFWFTPSPKSTTSTQIGVGPGTVSLSGRW